VAIEELARKILDHLHQPVIVVKRGHEIVYANPALQEHLHLSLDEIIGRPCYAVTHQSTEPCEALRETICPVKSAFESGTRSQATHKHLHENRLIVEEITATPLEGTDLVIEELRDISHLLGLVDGILPICSSCKRIRDEQGNWQQIEGYVASHTGADFSHGLCPDCLKRLYPEYHGRTG
jgi:PAS domain-containing protein